MYIYIVGVHSATITFRNNCRDTVWPATQTGGGKPQLSLTGFSLSPKETKSVGVPANWSGRIWARSSCATDSTGKIVCGTGDCGTGKIECNGATGVPPASLAEFTLGGFGGKDFYDISLVDGFNLPVSIKPKSGCKSTACAANVNTNCPPELGVKANSGAVIACKSACLAFNQPRYCCTGSFGSPATCPPTNYSLIFKNLCPQAYSYAYDDKSSTFTCATGGSYVVTICP